MVAAVGQEEAEKGVTHRPAVNSLPWRGALLHFFECTDLRIVLASASPPVDIIYLLSASPSITQPATKLSAFEAKSEPRRPRALSQRPACIPLSTARPCLRASRANLKQSSSTVQSFLSVHLLVHSMSIALIKLHHLNPKLLLLCHRSGRRAYMDHPQRRHRSSPPNHPYEKLEHLHRHHFRP